MSHTCGYPLPSGQLCRQRIQDPHQAYCYLHLSMPRPPEDGVPPGTCWVIKNDEGKWRCRTHSVAAWEVAQALGAKLPCRIPGASRLGSEEMAALDATEIRMLANEPAQVLHYTMLQVVHCPPDVLERFLQSSPRILVATAICNPGATADAMYQRFKTDETITVQQAARARGSEFQRVQVAGARPSASRPVQLLLAHDVSVRVRINLALNHTTASDVLGVMASKETDGRVLRAIARHPKAPPSALERLAHHETPKVRLRVATNANSPRLVLERLAQDGFLP